MNTSLTIDVPAWSEGTRVPDRFALGRLGDPMEMSDNISPAISWSGVPDGTKSIAIIMSDPDVPSAADDVNVVGRTVPADLPRITFTHWVLIDLPADLDTIPEGAASSGITPKGKDIGPSLGGLTGANDYTAWFDGDPEMGGVYGGYDGPCPPWNDSIVHHYTFDVFALDVETLGVTAADLTGPSAVEAMEGHVLARGSFTSTYSLNPDVEA